MLVVIDTNVLVSALWSRDGTPAKILDLVINGKIKPCFDSRILAEYKSVLSRPRFKFSFVEITSLMNIIEVFGFSVIPTPISEVFTDESDKKFYEVAKYCNAKLITGNIKHFPNEPIIMSPTAFLKDIN